MNTSSSVSHSIASVTFYTAPFKRKNRPTVMKFVSPSMPYRRLELPHSIFIFKATGVVSVIMSAITDVPKYSRKSRLEFNT